VGFRVTGDQILSTAAYARLSSQEKQWYNQGYPPNVVCYLAPEALGAFAALKKGSPVRVVARCKGKRKDDSVWSGQKVVLEECVLAPE
jgi:hypothetical protein